MSLTNDNSNMVMPVGPMMGNGYGMDGFGGAGGGWYWLLILFVFAAFNGNGFGFGGWGNGQGAVNSVNNDVQRGFDQQAVMNGINGISGAMSNGFASVQQGLCSGFAGVNANLANGFAQAEIAANARQMADMNQQFGLQTAITQGLNTIAMNQQNCCCENRAAIADLKYNVATEACADRNAISSALRDVLENNNAATQRILDQMCQDKIDAKNEKIAELQNQLTMANLAASQTAQTARLLADNAAQTQALEQYLNPAPIPSYTVQNPNCCQNRFGCGM